MTTATSDSQAPGLALLEILAKLSSTEISSFTEKTSAECEGGATSSLRGPDVLSSATASLYAQLADTFDALEVPDLARHFRFLASRGLEQQSSPLKFRGQLQSWGENEQGCLGQWGASSSFALSESKERPQLRPKVVSILRGQHFYAVTK